MKFQIKLFLAAIGMTSYMTCAQSEDVKPRYEAHWSGFDIGVNMLTNADMSTEFSDNRYWENNIAQSTSMHFNFLEYKLPIFKQYLGLTTGLGWHINSYGFKDDYVLYHNDSIVGAVMNPNQEYKQNYLMAHYFSVPLLLEFASKRRGSKNFYLSAGVVSSIRIGSRTTRKGTYDNGDKFKNVTRSKYNLNPIALDATVRMGYNNWGLFATYGLTSLFKENKTVGVYPLRFGLSFNIPTVGKDKSNEDFFEESVEEVVEEATSF